MSLEAAGARVVAEFSDALRLLGASDRFEVSGTPAHGLLAWQWRGPLRVCVPCSTELDTRGGRLRCPDCGSSCEWPVL
jgi:hypothetical protein